MKNIDLNNIKVIIFDFDNTLAINQDSDYIEHRNKNEDNLLKYKSKKSGLNESEFLRSCIKGYKVKEQPTKEIREFLKQISGIANNVNQIALRVNVNGDIQTDDIKYLNENINQFILDFQKKVYSRE